MFYPTDFSLIIFHFPLNQLSLTTLFPLQVPLFQRTATTTPLKISSAAIAIQTPLKPKLNTIPNMKANNTESPHIEHIARMVGNLTSPAAFILFIITIFVVRPNSRKMPINIT